MKSTISQKGYEPSTIMIYVKDRGIVLKESSMAFINSETNMIMAMGNEAEQNMDTAPPPAVAVNPLRRRIIANYTLAAKMFRFYLQKALGHTDSLWKRLK